MNKSQRIYFSTGDTGNKYFDKHISIKLEQDVETLEFLSMSIGTKDVYQNFNADYGVLIGRVIANGGVGIPNAKISVFIPLTDEDADNSDIYSIYPYTTPRDKNTEGKRYNLLPRVAKRDVNTGESIPKQPFGSFPIKEEIVTNSSFLEVYKKYYKYSTVTNNAGDYMIFGVPTGNQTIHLSVDITDIGEYSMNPASMVTNLGYSANLFKDNNTRIKPSNDLNDLPNIETQEISVDIIPFWGDVENFEIGITRQDFRIRSVLDTSFVLFGSAFTDGDNAMWGEHITAGSDISELYRANAPSSKTYGMYTKRTGKITEKIYYYPASISDEQIDSGTVEAATEMVLLSNTEYSSYKRNGDFIFIVSCNRNKIITNELGTSVPVPEDSVDGIYTKFRGFVTLEYTPEEIPMDFTGSIDASSTVLPFRYKLKFPQHAAPTKSLTYEENNTDIINNNNWRNEHFTFSGNGIYSFSRFHSLVSNTNSNDSDQTIDEFKFLIPDDLNNTRLDPNNNVGIIMNNDSTEYSNSEYEFPSNSGSDINDPVFGANWMNLTIYLPQSGYLSIGYDRTRSIPTNDHFNEQNQANYTKNSFFLQNNSQIIAGNQTNTKGFARSDINWTDIITVTKSDIRKMFTNSKGFKYLDNEITGEYRNGKRTPSNWGVNNAIPFDDHNIASVDYNYYFYKGFKDADCIQYLFELGLIN